MTRTKRSIIPVAVFVLTLAAGLVAGILAARLPSAAAENPEGLLEHSPLSAELQLTAEQREQMRSIWEGLRRTAHECLDDAKSIQQERDDAFVAMLSDEQKARYQKISKEYAEKFSAVTARREGAFKDAVERTKAILNERQRLKYDQIIRDRVGHASAGSYGLGSPVQRQKGRDVE